MGSLAAVLARSHPPDPSSVDRMLAAAPHRGSMVASAVRGSVAVGVARPERGTNASLAEADELTAAAVGRFDNDEELTAALGPWPDGPPPSPAALLVAAFRRWGDGATARLRGAFAAAVTDGERLWFFRDHLGFGTLYYRDGGPELVVATEAKQVVAGAGIPCEPDLGVVEDIFWGTYDDLTPAALRGVSRVPKARVLAADSSGARTRAYWHPQSLLETGRLSALDLEERFAVLMERAVTRAMTGRDVVALSGGIDSPAVAAFGARPHVERYGRPLEALSAVYPRQPSVDELQYVQIVVETLGMPLHTIEYRGRPLDRLREWARLFDCPVPTIWFSDLEEFYGRAASLGFDTVVTGELAEHLVDLRRYLLPHLLWRGRFGALASHVRGQRDKGVGWAGVAKQLGVAFVPAGAARAWERGQRTYRRAPIPSWLDPSRVKEVAVRAVRPARRRWLDLQLTAFEGPGLTMEADDVVQAVCGVTVRRPWADVDLWEFFLSLPAEAKLPGVQHKALLRRALRGRVPDAILDRTDKTVFTESLLARVDYDELQRWLVRPEYRLSGVDYRALAERLERRDLDLPGIIWAKDLATVHAFLSLW